MCAGNHPGDPDRERERWLAEEDEAMQADLARERRIEKTPVEIPQEIPTVGYEGYARIGKTPVPREQGYRPMRRFSFPNGVTVTVDEAARRVQTKFWDGLVVDAIPVYDAASIARALDLGFHGEDPVWQMTETHDLLHSVIAHWLGWPHSYALRAVAVGGQVDRIRSAWEESLVMAIQRACNEGYAGLLAEFEVTS